MSWIIRTMAEADLPKVTAIEEGCFSEPWSTQSFLDTITRDDTIYLVMEDNGEIGGYCGAYCILDQAEIPNVAVHPQYRCQGIALAMLTQLLECCKAKGIESVVLEVREGNQPAIRLYEKLGFQSCGIRKDFYRKPQENAVIMEKWI